MRKISPVFSYHMHSIPTKNMHRICIRMYLIMYCNNSLIQFSDTLELFQFVPGSKWADDNRILSDHIKPLAHTSLSNSDMANAGSTEFCLYVLFFIPFTTTAQQGLTNLIQLIVLQLKSCSALIRHVFNLSKATKSKNKILRIFHPKKI